MYKRTVSALYVVNIAFQAIFNLVCQIGLCILLSFLAVKYLSAPEWIYVPLILLGVFSGLYSMVRFILGAMRSLDRLEEQHRRDDNKK